MRCSDDARLQNPKPLLHSMSLIDECVFKKIKKILLSDFLELICPSSYAFTYLVTRNKSTAIK